jgi:hypothetical protein
MQRALLLVSMLSALALGSGCHICKGLHHKIQNRYGHNGCGGCSHGCPDGACGCSDGRCAECPDGHPDFYEPLHFGHQGPPERCGVLSWLGTAGPGVTPIPEQAQPAPGPSAAGVSYPYYTNRGPRDFLANDPRGIGPNY